MLLSPTYVVLALVVGYPILAALYLSLFRANDTIDPDTGLLGKGDKFVGLGNYADAFTGETGKRFLNAFENTTLFTICTVVLEVAIGVSMALIMNKAFRGRALVRASILVPWAIPTAVSAVLWGVMFQPSGVVNEVLSRGDNPILWSADNGWSFLAVVIADVWKTAPFVGLLTLAGLQIIPAEVYEAAKIDGSNAWQTFWRVTLPLVKPALIVAVLFRLLDVLRMFDLPQVLIGTNKHSVETLSQFAFDEMSNLRYGPASAYATLLFLYVVIIAFVFVRVLGADVIGSRVGGKK
jgi:multiple sugar transport system permease protein